MKIKLLTGITIMLTALSTPLFADSSHHQDKSPVNTQLSGGGMAMMDMEKMHAHMKKMKETMGQVHRAESKEARQKLMQQHMQEMRQGMSMMPGEMQENMPGMKGKHGEMMDAEKMKICHGMMGQRMEMMQGMMSQMMEHMQQQNMNMNMEK